MNNIGILLFLLAFSFSVQCQPDVQLLNSTYFNNGDAIPEANTANEWSYYSSSGQPVFTRKIIDGKTYFFYNWYAIVDKRGIETAGMIVPSITDFLIWNTQKPIEISANGMINESGHFSKSPDQLYFWSKEELKDKSKYEYAQAVKIPLPNSGYAQRSQAFKQEGFLVLLVNEKELSNKIDLAVNLLFNNNVPKSSNTSSSIPTPYTPSNSVEKPKKPIIQWASIPTGSFIMGSPNGELKRNTDEIEHKVYIKGFKMSAFEVTFEQYDAFCEATGRTKPSDEGWGRGRLPVINVSWEDANAFAKWMGCRLPTEAEWEYACRAGTTGPFYKGANFSTNQANFDGNYPYNNNPKGVYRNQAVVVGNFSPNAWGLYDMHGNVWEWCSDWYGPYNGTTQNNPTGPTNGNVKIIRGGGWYNDAHFCRSANRGSFLPTSIDRDLGFRIVLIE
jgi:formylglycine-generating enzyme